MAKIGVKPTDPMDSRAFAEFFIEIYEDTIKYNPDLGKRVEYVESLFHNTIRLIHEYFDNMYNKKFRLDIEKKLQEEYDQKYKLMRDEVIKEIKDRLDTDLDNYYY